MARPIRHVPHEMLVNLFPDEPTWWWEPERCPYPSGNRDLKKNPDPRLISEDRRRYNREHWVNRKLLQERAFKPYGLFHMALNLKTQIGDQIARDRYRGYAPGGYIFPPVLQRDEQGYANGADGGKFFDFIVEDTTEYSEHQPSFRPVLFIKFALIKEELSPTGHHLIEGSTQESPLIWEREQAFDTLIDILVIDPQRKMGLHWHRTPDGTFSTQAHKISEQEVVDLPTLSVEVKISNILFYGSVEEWEAKLQRDIEAGEVIGQDPRYPVPDRSHIQRVFRYSPEIERIDLGYSTGPVRDGRMWLKEVYTQKEGAILVTYYISKIGLEYASMQEVFELIKTSHYSFNHRPDILLRSETLHDRHGHLLLALEMCAKEGNTTYLERFPPYYKPYNKKIPTYGWYDLIGRYKHGQEQGHQFLLICRDTWDAAKQDEDLGDYFSYVDSEKAVYKKIQESELGPFNPGAQRDYCLAVIDLRDPQQPFNESVYTDALAWMENFLYP